MTRRRYLSAMTGKGKSVDVKGWVKSSPWFWLSEAHGSGDIINLPYRAMMADGSSEQ